MKVLVTYASKMGGTASLAEAVARGLGEGAEVRPMEEVDTVVGYDAVVLGGGLYAGRWPRAGRRFVRRRRELRDLPVWFFSSGPLDESAHEGPIEPTLPVRKLMDQVGAQGHVTFGGRLAEDASGFPAAAMAKEMAGDWRHPEDAEAWGAVVAAELAGHATG